MIYSASLPKKERRWDTPIGNLFSLPNACGASSQNLPFRHLRCPYGEQYIFGEGEKE